jgi:hypothetical protein
MTDGKSVDRNRGEDVLVYNVPTISDRFLSAREFKWLA